MKHNLRGKKFIAGHRTTALYFSYRDGRNSHSGAVLRIQDVYPGSWIPDPDFYPSRIPDPKTAKKRGVEKKFVVIPFSVATNFTKLLSPSSGSRKNLSRIPDQGSKRHRIPDPDPQHCSGVSSSWLPSNFLIIVTNKKNSGQNPSSRSLCIGCIDDVSI